MRSGAPIESMSGSMRYAGVGWRLVRTPGLRRFVIAPLAVNLAVFGGLGWWAVATFGDWLGQWRVIERFGDVWGVSLLLGLVQFLFTVAMVFALAWAFTLLANLVGAPFNGLLAERVEAHLTGRPPAEAGWLSMLRATPRLLGSELAKLLYLAAWLLPLLALQFVPLLNVIAPLLLFAFGAWMLALEYMDYPLGNHGALFRDVRRAAAERRASAFGFGLVIAALSAVPIINLVIMPVAVAGATALYVDHWRDGEPSADATTHHAKGNRT